MVLITYLPWHDTFLKLLPVLAELRRTDPNGFRTFLSEAYNQGIPDCGGSLKVYYSAGQSVSGAAINSIGRDLDPLVLEQHFTFERPLQFQLPSMPENVSPTNFYTSKEKTKNIFRFSTT